MSTKTNNSDRSLSSNDDGTLSKYSGYQRSTTSFNSSSIDAKNHESGIGTSIESSSASHPNRNNNNSQNLNDNPNLVIKRVELIEELKGILYKNKQLMSSTNSSSSSTISLSSPSNTKKDSDSVLDSGGRGSGSVSSNQTDDNSSTNLTSSDPNSINNKSNDAKKSSQTKPTANINTSANTTQTSTSTIINNNMNDLDYIMHKAIQYIKKLEKNQITKVNEKTSAKSNSSSTGSTSSMSIETPCLDSQKLIAKINNNDDMCISVLVKTGLIVYVDERLTNLLGQSTSRSWLAKRPIDHLYKHDCNLLLTKLCELTEKINSGFKKNISDIEIEPFFLRFKKESISSPPDFLSETKTSPFDLKKSPQFIFHSDLNEYIAFRVDLKADKLELKTLEEGEKLTSSTHRTNNNSNNNNSSNDSQSSNNNNNNKTTNLETCIMLKLSFPTIAYCKEMDNYTERSFITEHNINLEMTRVENKVTELLGYLPQDLEKRSFIKFIHLDDLEKIKQIHCDIYDGQDRQNQEIYRWRCFNGCYVSVKTNWSCFKHPWNKQIDFIIGKHIVLNEPLNKNIFEANSKLFDPFKPYDDSKYSWEKEEYQKTENEIIQYISRKIPGIDDATQVLGENMIKLIKKKKLSANFCHDQHKFTKKNQKPEFKLKSFEHAYEYPQYFFVDQNKSSKQPTEFFEPKISASEYRRMHKLSTKNNNKAKGSSNEKARSNVDINQMNMLATSPAFQHFSSNEIMSNKAVSSLRLDKDLSIANKYENMDLDQPKLNEENPIPTDMYFKNRIETSIFKEKGFFTHYMICKYIDDLPTHWEVDDMDQIPNDAQQEKEKPQQTTVESAMPSTSQQRGVKRTLSDENSADFTHPANKMAFIETGNKNIAMKKPSSIDASKTVELDETKTNENESQAKQANKSGSKPSSPTQNLAPATSSNSPEANANKNYFDNKSIVIDYLLKKNDDMTNKKTVQLNETSFKKESTLSSKSHSKIVLFDENDNDDEEEAAKSPQNENEVKQGSEQMEKSDGSTNSKLTFKEESLNLNSHEMDTIESSVYDSTHSTQTGNYAKFTKENLAKFTKEQDELYTQDILRKVQRPIKVFSECPQNICAQAPNVFSRNEYEPPMKRKKSANKENPSSPQEKQLKPVVSEEDDYENVGPYSAQINQIDCDNPQQYHQVFYKKLQMKYLSCSKEDGKENESAKTSRQDDACKKEPSNKSSSNENDTRTDDLIKYWKRCIKYESIIAKRLKEADKLLKIIFATLAKKVEMEKSDGHKAAHELSVISEHGILNKSDLNTYNLKMNEIKSVLARHIKELKKSLYTVANLLGINTDLTTDSVSNDSNKTETLDSYIKNIHQELVNFSNMSQNSSNTISTYLTKQVDPNSIVLLNFMYEDLKRKFLNQFQRFNQHNKKLFNSSSSLIRSTTTLNNEDDLSSHNNQNPALNNNNNPKSTSGSRSRSINDFEQKSTNNTNEFDDSSTYLYDSPTTSFESNDNNDKFISSKRLRAYLKSIRKDNTSNDSSNSSNNSSSQNFYSKLKVKLDDKSNNESESNLNSTHSDTTKTKSSSPLSMNYNEYFEKANLFHLSTSKHPNHSNKHRAKPADDENSYDDSLCVKLMQNYIDLFKNKSKSNNSNSNDSTNTTSQNHNAAFDDMIENKNESYMFKSKISPHHTSDSSFDSKTSDKNESSSSSMSTDSSSNKVKSNLDLSSNELSFIKSSDVQSSKPFINDTIYNGTTSNSTKDFKKVNAATLGESNSPCGTSGSDLEHKEDFVKHLNQNIYDDCFKCLSNLNDK